MNTHLMQCQTRMICAIAVLAWVLGGIVPSTQAADPAPPSPTVEGQKGDAGGVEERGIQRQTIPGTMPGTVRPGVKAPGGSFSALTKADCTGLGCKAVSDTTCKDVGGLRERCVCAGTTSKGLCIDEVK